MYLTSSRNKSANEMAFPHPQSRKHNQRKSDIPNNGSVIWKLFKRTINVTDYRNGEDEVNPANYRTFGGISHSFNPFPFRICCTDFSTLDCRVFDCFAAEK